MSSPLGVADNYLPTFQKCIIGIRFYLVSKTGPNIRTTVNVKYPGTRTAFIT